MASKDNQGKSTAGSEDVQFSGTTAGGMREYVNAQTGQTEQLDPNAADTKRRVESGELRQSR